MATRFKKGKDHPRYVPIGTEREDKDGYIEVKVADKRWRRKNVVEWEKVNGPIPKYHVVIFGDNNNRNFDPDNLILVSRGQFMRMRRGNLMQEDTELTKAALGIVKISEKIDERRSDLDER